jgi:hypothetical protein
MKKLAMLLFVLALCVPASGATTIDLKTAGSFGVLAGSGVTSTGFTVIYGDVGSFPTPSITGFPPGMVYGHLYRAAGAVVGQAKTDLLDAYNAAAGAPVGVTRPDAILGNETLSPNVYDFNDEADLAGTLTLDGGGDSDAQWIFQIPSTLTTATGSTVLLINGASAKNVFWQVGSSATIGINNIFAGNILASKSITFNGGTLNGRALASDGAVTFSTAETINAETINVPGNVYVPSDAILLVYKLTMAVNPLTAYNDATGIEAEVLKQNVSAYVVFGVNHAYDVNGPTVILFGKDGRDKFQMTLGGNEPNSFVNLGTFGSDASIMPFVVTNKKKTMATSVGIEFGDSDATTGFDIETELYGKNTTIDIGFGKAEKLSVAKSLKGQVWFGSEGRFLEGWGTAKATLDSKLTKDANKNSRTVAATVANIQTTVLHIYTPVTVLP